MKLPLLKVQMELPAFWVNMLGNPDQSGSEEGAPLAGIKNHVNKLLKKVPCVRNSICDRKLGKKKISQVAAALKLTGHHTESAQRLFMLAVQHNFIQGRRTNTVVAACLYIICRRERTPRIWE
jgi:hypothetical protein